MDLNKFMNIKKHCMLINKLKFKLHKLITYNRKEINRTRFKSNLFYLLVNKLNNVFMPEIVPKLQENKPTQSQIFQ